MEYRIAKSTDCQSLAKIHLQAFDGFFLTSLGNSFLRTYYQACIESNESINVCAVNEFDDIIGFSIGCVLSKGFHKRLLIQNFPKFFIQGIIILLSRPNALSRLVNNLEKNDFTDDNGNYAELLSIGVLPNYNGQGIGKELIKRFEEEAINKGCKEMALTTDFNKNSNVLEFYKSVGYEIYYEFLTYPDRKMYKLKKNLNKK